MTRWWFIGSMVVITAVVATCRPFTDPPVTRGFTAWAPPESLLADGLSTVSIAASIDTIVNDSNRAVVFTTTGGGFVPSGASADTVIADSGGGVSAMLRAPRDTGGGVVSASYAHVTRSAPIHFAFAAPQRVDVTPGVFSVSDSLAGTIVVTAVLRRTFGYPSTGITVNFVTHDTLGTTRGEFTPAAPSDSTGTITVTFSPVGETYVGRAFLVASVPLPTGILSDSIAIAMTP